MTEQQKRIYQPITLCELCTKACGRCSWSEYGVQLPVEGWTAIRRDLTDAGESYLVMACPEFELEDGLEWALKKFSEKQSRARLRLCDNTSRGVSASYRRKKYGDQR